MVSKKSPNPIDVHVGARVRLRRMDRGHSGHAAMSDPTRRPRLTPGDRAVLVAMASRSKPLVRKWTGCWFVPEWGAPDLGYGVVERLTAAGVVKAGARGGVRVLTDAGREIARAAATIGRDDDGDADRDGGARAMSIWTQTGGGRAVDLAAPDIAALDIAQDIAEPLARTMRFAGHAAPGAGPGVAPGISVAQHCVVGADALLDETGDVACALAFLIHDAHEALLGDLTTPSLIAYEDALHSVLRTEMGGQAAEALFAGIAARRGRRGPLAFAVDLVKASIDVRIHARAGLPHPLPLPIARHVREMDIRMLDLERRHGLGALRGTPTTATVWPHEVLTARPVKTRGRLTPWPATRARDEWMRRWDMWRVIEREETTR